ncbi:response regulator [Herminiimonas sp. CN]|uniref:response regulator n=1 Tax=Herminiimonas sp. CN TaxID=1349818 RepID=UPI000473B9E9|nr:response regulator [Herminiimonas sp. CN]
MANILVVDDEMGIRELLSEILSDEGHAVQLAENAGQARQQRAAGVPDLVLLDIWMPDTDGVTLLKEWQRDGLLTMPVIMMSGHATIDTAVEATRIGAINFLEKPISLQKLLKAVQQGLSKGSDPARIASSFAKTMPPPAPEPAAAPAQAPAPGSVAGHAAHALPATAEINEARFFAMTLELPLREARDAFERVYFEYHLGREGGSMTRVADKTGLERTHLYRKLKQLGIESVKAARKLQGDAVPDAAPESNN